MAKIYIAMRAIKCINLFDKFLNELSCFDLCITQKQSKEKFQALLLQWRMKEQIKNHNESIPPIVLIY